LPEAAYEALREVAFKERAKIHDLVLQGIELSLRKRGYPSIESLKAKYARKGVKGRSAFVPVLGIAESLLSRWALS